MGKFTEIDAKLRDFIAQQQIFFVATAAPEGRVGLAPKGMDSLRVLAPKRVVWLNLTGSENETAAHLLESPRMSLMWCSFTAKPLILRVYGKARAIHPRDPDWAELLGLFPSLAGARQILDVAVEAVLTSCGFGVPRYDFVAQRPTLVQLLEEKGEAWVEDYWANRNTTSLDGKPTGIFGNSAEEP
ncbi:MAG: pyridoxamine 5'-phosphate oxidase family protein [Rhodospirillales bacterium]